MQFAERMHTGQLYGTNHYSFHLNAVRNVLSDFEYHGPITVAAWLHDTLEDTKATREQLATLFGDEVARLVWCVTGEGETREIRNACVYKKLQTFPGAIPLKLADRIANMEHSVDSGDARHLAMYRQEYPAFREALFPRSKKHALTMWARLEVSACRETGDESWAN